MTKKDFKKLILVMRDMVPVFTAIMCAHCGLLVCGYNFKWVEVVLGLLVFHVLYVSSNKIGLCRLHRAGLLYGYAVYFCCNFERVIGFGALRHPAQCFMFILGLILCTLFAIRFCEIRKKNKEKKLKEIKA